MSIASRLKTAAVILCLLGAHTAGAASLVSSVQLVADAAVAMNPIPPAQTFTLAQGGSFTVTLTDLQLPAALSSLSVAIATPTTLVTTLPVPSTATTTTPPATTATTVLTQTVTLLPGTYTAQVLASAASGAAGGTFSLQIAPAAGGPAVLQYEDAVGPANSAPSSGQTALSAKLTVSAAGSYQLTVNDLAFPAALSALQLIVLNDCGTQVGCVSAPVSPTPLTGPSISQSLTLPAGTYDLFAVATADSTALAGLYTVQLVGGPSNATLFAAAEPVGQLPPASVIAVPSAQTVTLQVADLVYPVALTMFQGVVVQGASVLAHFSASGTSSFAAAAGNAQLFVVGQPPTQGQGAYAAYATAGGQTLLDVALPVLANTAFGYTFPTTLADAGTYQLTLYDFQLPVALTSLNAVVEQRGVALASTTNGATSVAVTAQAGPVNIVVLPVLAAAADSSLFGLSLATQSSGAVAYQTTQGVGEQFNSQTVAIGSAGTYRLQLTDLQFPAKFNSLAVIITQGNTVVGQIFGSSQIDFSPTAAGTYVLNVLTEVDATANYGLFGLNLDVAPPPPTVTLTASLSNVTAGNSAALTWASTNASSCQASAMPASTSWTGPLGTSGSVSTGALTATTTFTISCTSADNSVAMASATIKVAAAAASKHGGGAFGAKDLIVLSATCLYMLWRRRYRSPGTALHRS